MLEVLWRTTRPLTGREVSRLVRRGSEPGVRLALRRMAAHGLVHARETGNAIEYTLNREHVAADALEILMSMRTKLFQRILEAIEGWAIKPALASVFGSAARADGDLRSDVDLLLVRPPGVHDGNPAWEQQVHTLAQLIHTWSGNHASIAQLGISDMRELKRKEIVDSLRRDGVTLFGSEIDVLLGGRGSRRAP